MYKSVHIQNFRGFTDLRLHTLSRVNIIGGKNNVGKTSLLEALFILGNPTNTELLIRVNVFRGIPSISFNTTSANEFLVGAGIDSVFNGWTFDKDIVLSAQHEQNGTVSYRYQVVKQAAVRTLTSESIAASANAAVNEAPMLAVFDTKNDEQVGHMDVANNALQVGVGKPTTYQTLFISYKAIELFDALAARFTQVLEQGEVRAMVEALRAIEPRLQGLQLLQKYGHALIAGDLGDGKFRPLIMMGEGLMRGLQLALGLWTSRGGVVLIDEVETGFHHSAQTAIWRMIYEAAEKFNVQVFATTHSFEMLQAAHTASLEVPNDLLRYYRLERDNDEGTIATIYYDQESMASAMAFPFEVRG